MSADARLRRLRAFLFGLAALLFAGTVMELLLAEHYDDPLQLIPFALCGLGLVVLAAVWVRPARRSMLALRATMAVIAAGSLLGMWEHLQGNRGFALEVHPEAGGLDLLRSSLTGADPMLAPGILAVAALVAVAATYAGSGQRVPAPTSAEVSDHRSSGHRAERPRHSIAGRR